LSIDNTTYHSAPGAARINVTSILPGGMFKLYQSIPIQSGVGYTLSFWAKASAPQQFLLHLYSPTCPQFRCLSDQFLQLGTTWQRYEIPFVASGTAPLAGFNIFIQSAGTVWLDDFSLREGDTSVYRRDFENGVAILNYTTIPQTVNLGTQFRHLTIPGSSLYDGALVSSEVLQPSDGRILLTASTPAPAPPPVPETLLQQNEPNPFNPSTRIRYKLSRDEPVHLAVYDIAGRLVRTLVDRRLPGGIERTVTWDGTDRWGQTVRSGVYFYRITTPTFTESKKMTLLK
jgi:hypothetical protein